MRSTSWIILLLCAGCTAHVAPSASPSKVTALAQEASPSPESAASQSAPAPSQETNTSQPLAQVIEHNDAALRATAEEALADSSEEGATEDEDEAADGSDADEGEAHEAAANTAVPTGPLYTAELSDEQLTEMWKKEPSSLGSISVGFVESGRMVNSVRVPEGNDWIVVSPELAWGTQETVDYITRAIREVRAQYPKAPPLRVNQLSSREGGYLRPHKSHQNGRDVDLGFYYPTAEPIRVREREKHIDLELNWALVKTLAIHTDVQMILVDKRVQKVLYEYALRKGENKEWLDSLFHAGAQSLIKHARGHRDHFHVRFFNARAQELGRRVAPLLALQPDKNIQMHRVRSGDTVGGIALRYGSSIAGIKKANRMRGVFLRIGQVLAVPLRGPCTRCPIPAPVVLPPRRMPPDLTQQAPAVAQQAPAASEPQTPAAPQAPTVTEPQAPVAAQQAPAAASEQQAPVAAQQTPSASEPQTPVAEQQTSPTATESQAPVAEQQAPAASEPQPTVTAQQESTGGSAPASAEAPAPAQEQPQPAEPSQQQPAVQGVPASSHTSAAIMPVGTSSLQ